MEQQNPFRAPKEYSPGGTPTTHGSMTPLAWFCIGYYALAILWGARSAVASERSAGDLVFQVMLALCLGAWAIADARRRQKPIPRSRQFWFFILAWAVVPGYVIVTRGWKGLGWTVLHFVGWYAIAVLAMGLTGLIYFGDEWWAAMAGE